MDFSWSPEQDLLRDGVRKFLARSAADVRKVMATREGFDRAVWRRMAEELGLHGIGLPEEYGGAGATLLELGIVCEELGRTVHPSPFFSSVILAGRTILAVGSEDEKRLLLPNIASGESIAALALLEEGGAWDLDAVTTLARRDGDAFVVDGEKAFVSDGHVADLFVVVARVDGALSAIVVERDAPGLTVTPLSTMDQTRRQARLSLSAVRGRLLGPIENTFYALTRALDEAAVCLSCEMLGGASRALEAMVDYAKVRTQFGRAIGSFQAIKHTCAEVFLEVESARSAAYWAAWARANDDAEATIAASAAKSWCCDAYFHAAAACIQVHGGIGFTWEHDAHLHLKRARSAINLLGDPVLHRERVARQLDL